MVFNDYGGIYPEHDASLIKDIEKAINEEYSAIACYGKLGDAAPSHEERVKIREIRKDEIKHFQIFSEIYTALTGQTPTPRIIEARPQDHEAETAAFNDESAMVEFYI